MSQWSRQSTLSLRWNCYFFGCGAAHEESEANKPTVKAAGSSGIDVDGSDSCVWICRGTGLLWRTQ